MFTLQVITLEFDFLLVMFNTINFLSDLISNIQACISNTELILLSTAQNDRRGIDHLRINSGIGGIIISVSIYTSLLPTTGDACIQLLALDQLRNLSTCTQNQFRDLHNFFSLQNHCISV